MAPTCNGANPEPYPVPFGDLSAQAVTLIVDRKDDAGLANLRDNQIMYESLPPLEGGAKIRP